MKKLIERSSTLRGALLLCVTLLACSGTWAQGGRTTGTMYYHGTHLEEMCADSSYTDDICFMYILGVSDALMYQGTDLGGYCIPYGVKSTQLPKIYARWIKRHPEIEHYPAVELIRRALKEAYPCDE